VNLLTAWEFELGAAQRFHGDGALLVFGTDGHQHLANVASCCSAITLAPSSAHACLQAIGSRARQHLVDTEHLEWVRAHANVKEILSCIGNHVLVSCNARCFQCFRGDLLILV